VAPTNLERQIRSQPEELARVAGVPLGDAADRLRPCRRVWLVGTGTSQHAAELGAAMLMDAGVDARGMSSMGFVRFGPSIRGDDGVIVVSHTAGAETTYAAAARRRALDAGAAVVSVTRRGGGLPKALETVEKETSQTYTVS